MQNKTWTYKTLSCVANVAKKTFEPVIGFIDVLLTRRKRTWRTRVKWANRCHTTLVADIRQMLSTIFLPILSESKKFEKLCVGTLMVYIQYSIILYYLFFAHVLRRVILLDKWQFVTATCNAWTAFCNNFNFHVLFAVAIRPREIFALDSGSGFAIVADVIQAFCFFSKNVDVSCSCLTVTCETFSLKSWQISGVLCCNPNNLAGNLEFQFSLFQKIRSRKKL